MVKEYWFWYIDCESGVFYLINFTILSLAPYSFMPCRQKEPVTRATVSVLTGFVSYFYFTICMCVSFVIRKENMCRFAVITGSLAKWVECSPMVRETGVQSQVESYERLKKWYLIHPCLTLSNIRYVSRVKWSNPGKGVAPSPTPRCSNYWKGSLLVSLDYGRQLYKCGDEKISYYTVSILVPYLEKIPMALWLGHLLWFSC